MESNYGLYEKAKVVINDKSNSNHGKKAVCIHRYQPDGGEYIGNKEAWHIKMEDGRTTDVYARTLLLDKVDDWSEVLK